MPQEGFPVICADSLSNVVTLANYTLRFRMPLLCSFPNPLLALCDARSSTDQPAIKSAQLILRYGVTGLRLAIYCGKLCLRHSI
jgi:hypothetical protein